MRKDTKADLKAIAGTAVIAVTVGVLGLLYFGGKDPMRHRPTNSECRAACGADGGAGVCPPLTICTAASANVKGGCDFTCSM